MRTSSRTLENTAASGRFSLVHFALYLPLPIWLFIVLWAGATGVFESAPSKPPLPLLVAVTGPPLAFAVFYRASARFRGFIFGIDLRLLTALQAWRVLGGMFPVLYSFGLLPGLFAWPAGVGDVAVGVVAPFALLAMVRGAPTWRRQVPSGREFGPYKSSSSSAYVCTPARIFSTEIRSSMPWMRKSSLA